MHWRNTRQAVVPDVDSPAARRGGTLTSTPAPKLDRIRRYDRNSIVLWTYNE